MEAPPDLPFASAMIVVRNERDMIGQCLDSLLNQDYPKDRYEVIVIDGMSDDGTLEAVRERCGKLPRVHILSNPKRSLAAGWNLGVRAAEAEYVVRLDAHAAAAPDFLRRSVKALLDRPDVACVGGSMETRATSRLGQAIADVLSSPFGVGDSRFRTSRRAQYVDTVAFGLYRRRLLLELGGFNEEMKRNQDLEMHARVRRVGWRFYLDPSIRTIYYARSSLRSFLTQAWQNGWWNILTLVRDREAVSVRHLVPLAFVAFVLTTGTGALLWRPLLYPLGAVLSVYLLLGCTASLRGSRSLGVVALKPALFLTLHGAYGAGSLACILRVLVAGSSFETQGGVS
jgi:cellulose synthase/poly-beta-1,6-N-acetylglucosamine synthase-like glycosyltransferase